MEGEPNLSLRRSKQTGAWICLGSLVGAGIFVVGVLQGSYWALAVPVTVGVLGVLLLAFWIGFTINTINAIPKEAEQYNGAAPRRIALLICAVAVGLAVAFVGGVLQGSYAALAIPVAAAVLGLLGMIFWIGWAIVTQRSTLASGGAEPSAKTEPSGEAEPSAKTRPSGKTKTSAKTKASAKTEPSGKMEPSAKTGPSGKTEPSAKTAVKTEPSAKTAAKTAVKTEREAGKRAAL